MNANLSPVLDIIYEAETARKEGCRRVCELLSLDPTSTIAHILLENENQLGDRSFRALLEKVGDIVTQHKVQRNITDWPFENFWNNPHEPRHSKLLGYFIDPKQGHGCDDFLRLKLLEVLGNSLKAQNCRPTGKCRFRADECKVEAETRDVQPGDNKSGQIDLLITRQCDDDRSDNGRNFAIIVENKINRAPNRPEQLQTYVARFRRARFSDEQIFVFFLPLTDDLDPGSDDLKAILEKVTYAKITFEKHIRAWLKVVLEEWPANLDDRIREHLNYYRSLINYLINKRKQDAMSASILKQLEQAEKNNTLPSFLDVEKLKQCAQSLFQCMQLVFRGTLLLRIHGILEEKGIDARFCLDTDHTEIDVRGSPYDEQFGANVNLCISVDEVVNVCFGAGPDGFWLGYRRNGNRDKQKKIESFVLAEAERLKCNAWKNETWYGCAYRREVIYDNNCVTKFSRDLAGTLVDMRKSLVDRLNKEGVRS